MTCKEAKEKLKDYIHQTKEDGDSYLCVHFSRSEDYYAVTQSIDMADAMVIIQELARYFEIDLNVVAASQEEEKAELN